MRRMANQVATDKAAVLSHPAALRIKMLALGKDSCILRVIGMYLLGNLYDSGEIIPPH